MLQARAAQPERADLARAEWYAHTAETRAAAMRATAELSARQAAAGGHEDPAVTAEEWLAEHTAAIREDDEYREITDDTDFADLAEQRAADVETVEPQPHQDAAGTAVSDIRETAATERPRVANDAVRVPSAEETAYSIQRAQRARAEIRQRNADDVRRAAEEARAQQLARWHADDVRREALMIRAEVRDLCR